MATAPSRPVDGERHCVLILGGGTAGIGTAAQLRKEGVEDICIVEPSADHYYQVCCRAVVCGMEGREGRVAR